MKLFKVKLFFCHFVLSLKKYIFLKQEKKKNVQACFYTCAINLVLKSLRIISSTTNLDRYTPKREGGVILDEKAQIKPE